MSYYTKYADVEGLLTSTTTNTIASTDALVVFNVASGKMYQTTPVAVSGVTLASTIVANLGLQTLTSASTATNILPTGITTIQSSNALSYLLTAAAGPGFMKTVVTSSTGVITVVTSLASLSSTGAINGTQFILNSAGAAISGGGITLVSVGTSPSTRWITVGYSGTTILS